MTDTEKTDIEKLRAELERILAEGFDDSGVWWLRATIDLYERVKVLEARQQADRVLIACLEKHVEALEALADGNQQMMIRHTLHDTCVRGDNARQVDEKAELADLRTGVAQFAKWLVDAEVRHLAEWRGKSTRAMDAVRDKFHELRLDEKEST